MTGRAHVDQAVRRAIAMMSGTVAADEIQPDHCIAKLGLDSLDVVEMTQEIESTLNIRLNDDAVRAAGTVGQLVDLVHAIAGSAEAAASGNLPKDRDFCLARTISQAAFFLDEYKINFAQSHSAEVQKHIATLHAVAIELAGTRAHELYPIESENTLTLADLARQTGCAEDDEEAGPGGGRGRDGGRSMKTYLIDFGHGIRRRVIDRDPFAAIRAALGTLTIADQLVIRAREFHIKCEPEGV